MSKVIITVIYSNSTSNPESKKMSLNSFRDNFRSKAIENIVDLEFTNLSSASDVAMAIEGLKSLLPCMPGLASVYKQGNDNP